MYDLIIRGGILVDPSQGIHERMDVAFRQGRVAQVSQNLGSRPGKDAHQVLDASSRIVTPGLIDIHFHSGPYSPGHVFHQPQKTRNSPLEPDAMLGTGTTTLVDAGTYGVETFSLVVPRLDANSRVQLFAWINAMPFGTAGRVEERYLDETDLDRLVETCKRNAAHIVGIKVILSRRFWQNWGTPLDLLDLAREAADLTDLPLMVHGVRWDDRQWLGGVTFRDVLARLRSGDVVTHSFCRNKGFVTWGTADQVREAVSMGVLLDVGHGSGSFSFDAAARAIELELPPTTISTDLHGRCYMGPTYDLPTTMSKFLLLGLSLDEVVERVTTVPAQAIGQKGNLGTLKPGAVGDAVVFDRRGGQFAFEDSYGRKRVGQDRLVPRAVVRGGVVYLGGTWSEVGWVAPAGPLYPPRHMQSRTLGDVTSEGGGKR